MAKEPEKIGGLINGYLRSLGLEERLDKQEAVVRWAKIMGPKIASESEALKIDEATLVVKVNKPAWRQQLSFMKAELLAKLNSELGAECIKDIRFI